MYKGRMSNYFWNFSKAWPELHSKVKVVTPRIPVFRNRDYLTTAQLALDGGTYVFAVSGELKQLIDTGKVVLDPIYTVTQSSADTGFPIEIRLDGVNINDKIN